MIQTLHSTYWRIRSLWYFGHLEIGQGFSDIHLHEQSLIFINIFWFSWTLIDINILFIGLIVAFTRKVVLICCQEIYICCQISPTYSLCCHTPLEKSSCKNSPNLFFIVLDNEWLPEKLSVWPVYTWEHVWLKWVKLTNKMSEFEQ